MARSRRQTGKKTGGRGRFVEPAASQGGEPVGSDIAPDLLAETLAEPFRIKTVERIRLPSRDERQEILKSAFYSIVHLRSADVFIDLATDSGTGAMSDGQWAALMRGDEVYLRSKSFEAFEQAVREVTGYPYVMPTHQGRSAENILMGSLVKPGDVVLCNAHFDTTRAHVENQKGCPVDLISDVVWQYEQAEPFKGNFDLEKLRVALKRHHERVPFIIITVLNNMACSSPVSMENIRRVKGLADQYKIPVYFDACRFAENAYFIKKREPGYARTPIAEIVREMFSYGSGCWMSAKKDAIVNTGGFLALRDEGLAQRCQEKLLFYEGFPTYGGLARRDLEAAAVGLREGMDEHYLAHRTSLVAYLGAQLKSVGIVVSQPVGGSGVFVDVEAIYPHLGPDKFSGIAFASDLYLEGAVRVGAMPLRMNRVDPAGEIFEKVFQFARLAVPRRTYTKSHMEYVAKVMRRVKERAPWNKGYRVVEMPEVLGHFFAKFEPI